MLSLVARRRLGGRCAAMSSRMRPSLARALSLSCAHFDDGGIETEIFDDGPGIAPGLRSRVRSCFSRATALAPSKVAPALASVFRSPATLLTGTAATSRSSIASPTASAFVNDLQTPAAHPGLGSDFSRLRGSLTRTDRAVACRMIAGGNWWRANEIVIPTLPGKPRSATIAVTRPSPRLNSCRF